ncbi:MAG: hypothetical protein JO255_03505 [Alphaproteobacteria bacterium]|nr:hypothetical protein [Alphaproteobacteria bacterium]
MLMNKHPLIFLNDGAELVETNFWQTEMASRGAFFLSTNAGCLRLLVPASREPDIAEMTKGVREVVLSRGRWDKRDHCVEIMFEDASEAPYAIHIGENQLDRRWKPQGGTARFAIYTEKGKVAEFSRCYLRETPVLPCLAPWEGKR